MADARVVEIPIPTRYFHEASSVDFVTSLRYAFKTPTLREIKYTGPYMDDVSLKTLEEVVEHYDKGGIKNQWLNERMAPLKLTKEDKADLVTFLKALSGEGWQQIREPKSEEMPR